MSEAKHTPGPLIVSDLPNLCHRIETVSGHTVAITVHRGAIGSSERLANARLIAAAPDMYEALKDALDAWETHNHSGDMMQGYWADNARSALSKAGGRS